MCGILGRLSLRARPRTEFDAALTGLDHRGPDQRKAWHSADERLSLGHTRLSIVGIENGEQPMISQDGHNVAVVNGEFYDFESRRRELEREGCRFKTDSDSELLLHLYEKLGADCVGELRGEFAFALWDGRAGRLMIARDRFGVKPLVWSIHDGAFYVASKAAPILQLTGARTWDVASFSASVHHQYTAPNRTLFDGIYQVEPGTTLLVDRALKTETVRYWSLEFGEKDASAKDDFSAALTSAVHRRLQGDLPVACGLSGGIDSSSVCALVRERQTSVDAFGIVFPNAGKFDEREHAEAVANFLDLNYHPIETHPLALLEMTRDAVTFAEGLAINGHLPAKFLLSRTIRDAGHKVVLTGEGADELLLGYPHFLQDLSHDVDLSGVSSGVMVSSNASHVLDDRLGFTPHFVAAKLAMGERIRSVTTGTVGADILAGFDLAHLQNREPVEISATLWTRLTLANYILNTLGDGTEMAHSIEGRTPFLDVDLFDVCRRIPTDQKIAGGIEKQPLRDAMRGRLPDDIVSRRKQPFIAPPICFDPSTEDWMLSFLHSSELRAMPFFEETKLIKLWHDTREKDLVTQQLMEPVFMTAITSTFLQQSFGLEVR